ncbi:MAG: ATP-binding cassette domain-containing protein [Oscillospiraceae bacterium]|nr:ATP-binding cassette domain-containing protein [Oscillospiraceae bacterium]
MPDEIIKVSGLTKDYGNGRGIFGFDFSVKRGEVFGIVGTNGSGKTTTLRHLMGFLNPDSGSCGIMGLDCRKHAREIMQHVGYVPGEIDFPDVGTGTSFLKIQAEFMGLKDREYISRLVNLFKLDTDASLRRMSKGMKQKTALVAAFMSRPEVLLLDEPSTGLDPLMRDALIELILEEKARGTTVLMSTHIFKELDDTADRVLFIENGRQIDLADMHSMTETLPQRYRLGFKTQDDFDSFAAATAFRIARANPAHLHMDVEIPEQSVSGLFREIGNYDMRYMKYRPFTLEDRYTEMIEKGGKISA